VSGSSWQSDGAPMVEEKARELGRLIGQSKEYQELRRANEALGQDTEAVKLLKEMEQLRSKAQQMIERGERPTQEMEQQLDGLLQQVQVQRAYQRLIAAQENFDKLMSKVNEWILEGIEKGSASPIIMLG
jgi:cell fate (sporulation/competence/biofilm development) regulator YlbF (YheA/YmcA/DUF963 family)